MDLGDESCQKHSARFTDVDWRRQMCTDAADEADWAQNNAHRQAEKMLGSYVVPRLKPWRCAVVEEWARTHTCCQNWHRFHFSVQAGRQAGGHQPLKSSCSTFFFNFRRLKQVSLYVEKEAGCQLKQKGGESRWCTSTHAVCFVLFLLPSCRLVRLGNTLTSVLTPYFSVQQWTSVRVF